MLNKTIREIANITTTNEELERLQYNLFLLKMKDHWTEEDFAESARLKAKIKEWESKES